MSEETQMESLSDEMIISKTLFSEMLVKNFSKLPSIDQKFVLYGPHYLSFNSAFAGLIANSLYRRALNVRMAKISSNLPAAVLPYFATCTLYSAMVSGPLLSGEFNCPSCVLMRGALVGVLCGGLYPILLALPLNAGLAARYHSTALPEMSKMFRFAVDVSRPVLKKMRIVIVIQALFGTYLSSRDLKTYNNLLKITFGSSSV